MNVDTSRERPDGITVMAIVEFVLAAPLLIGALAILLIPIPAVLMGADEPMGIIAALFGLGIGVLFTGGLAVALVAAGIGLLKMQNWARIVTIIVAILFLPGFPVGTVLGAVALWYLFQDETKAAFGVGTTPSATPPGQTV